MENNQLITGIPILDVRNINASLAFYTGKLGFQLEFRYANDPDNYAGVYRDNVYLHMQWQSEEEFKKGTARGIRYRIYVKDPATLYKEFNDNNAIQPGRVIQDTEWGTREFTVFDPDGNVLTFFSDKRP